MPKSILVLGLRRLADVILYYIIQWMHRELHLSTGTKTNHGRVHGGTVFDTSALVTQKSGDGAAKKGGGGKKKRGAAAMSAGKKGAPAARARVLADEEGVNDMDVDDEDEEGIPPGIE